MDITSKTGMELPPFQFTVERGKIQEFARAIGDDNPIYFSLTAAQSAGFRDIPIPPTFPIAIDMWAGMDFEQLVNTLQVNPLRVLHGEQQYEYISPVCAGDELTGTTRIISAVSKRNMNLFTLETSYQNQHGECVLISRAVVIERL